MWHRGGPKREHSFHCYRPKKYIDCYLRIHCRENLLTESLPSNGRLFWLHYSGVQASCCELFRWADSNHPLEIPFHVSVFSSNFWYSDKIASSGLMPSLFFQIILQIVTDLINISPHLPTIINRLSLTL
jgi:hypothetical protein